MDFDLPAPVRAALETARRFIDREVLPIVRREESARRFPRELVGRMGREGFFGAALPPSQGGTGLGWEGGVALAETFGGAWGSLVPAFYTQGTLLPGVLAEAGRLEVSRRLVSGERIGAWGVAEAEAGSDRTNLATRAIPKGSDWILNGAKIWVTHGTLSDVLVVLALLPDGTRGLFLVEGAPPGLVRRGIGPTLGLRSAGIAEVFLNDVRVGEGAFLRRVDEGELGGLIDRIRLILAAGAVGIGAAAVREAVRHARERRQGGRTIGAYQLVQARIVEAELQVEAARLLVLRAAREAEQGRGGAVVAAAKLKACEAAREAAEAALETFGSEGYSEEYLPGRLLRDARAFVLDGGTPNLLRLEVAGGRGVGGGTTVR